MNCPYFTVPQFGVFDSNIKYPRMSISTLRTVSSFELELCTTEEPNMARIDDKEYLLQYGSLVCAKPGQQRQSHLPYKCLYFHLNTADPELLALLQQLPTTSLPPNSHELKAAFQGLLTVTECTTIEDRLFLESRICQILRLLSQQLRRSGSGGEQASAPNQAILLAARTYIREHLAEPLSLSALAEKANLSPTYFHRLFTDYFGITPAQYILDCRINAAKTGLLTGDYSLSELAADCGFSTQTYFCYKFKQATGQTPMQYRKEMLGRTIL